MAKFPVREIVTAKGESVVATDLSSTGKRVTGSEILSGFPPIQFLLRHWIPRGKVIVLAGAGGAGKSSVLVGFAVARALGLPHYLGLSLVPGATLFVTGEDEAVDYGRRITSWVDHLCDGEQTIDQCNQVAQHITFADLVGEDLRLVARDKRDYAPDLAAAQGIAERVRCTTPRPDLVVIETVSRFGGDESNQAHAALIDACEVIAKAADCAVVLVSHTGKANARDSAFDAYASRGGSALADNARGTIIFGRMPSDLHVQKEILGRVAFPDEKKNFILLLARSTFSPPQDPVLLRPHSVRDSLVLEEEDPISAATMAGIRNARNAILRNAVAELMKEGDVVLSKLRKRGDLLPNIPYRGLKDAVEDAIADRVLAYGPKGARGAVPIILGDMKPTPTNGAVHEMSEWETIVPFGDASWKN